MGRKRHQKGGNVNNADVQATFDDIEYRAINLGPTSLTQADVAFLIQQLGRRLDAETKAVHNLLEEIVAD
jgi:hypothetical protein